MFSSNSSQVSSAYNYIEDVFSTYLYTGTGATQSINNGIDLSTNGGLTWIKCRSNAQSNWLTDTARGATNTIFSDSTSAQSSLSTGLTAFNTNGFTVSTANGVNANTYTYASWTFRKQPKFFDIQTWSGSGSSSRTLSHALGSTPGCIIVKGYAGPGNTNWWVYHQSIGTSQVGILNTTAAFASTYATNTFPSAPTSTNFTVGDFNDSSGYSFVAYIFASNAGGFGLTGSDNVITCGSFTSDAGGNANISLGYEPQFVIYKSSAVTGDWFITDTMRGLNSNVSGGATLYADTSAAETAGGSQIAINATGFTYSSSPNKNYIYIAIRRGPMAVPTTGTSVFSPVARTGTGANATVTAGFTPDVLWYSGRNAYYNRGPVDKLRGVTKYMYFTSSSAEQTFTTEVTALTNTGMTVGDSSSSGDINTSGIPYINWFLQRAPSFFDEVCYTGTGSATTVNHNLGVVPELIIIKSRTSGYAWTVYNKTIGNTGCVFLSATNAATFSSSYWNNTSPTSSVFTVGTALNTNASGNSMVAYLFATCAWVSKVGSYTGNGSTQAIACGFTGGARFVLIKRTDDVGDWYVYDTARGMTTLTDPYLLLNSTAAESATLGSVTTTTGGFTVDASILAAINTSSATYIFLAIA
jgi:hypothetical protein